jgi:uridylate kinase
LPVYKRVLLKLSGEAMAARDRVFDLDTLKRVAMEIKDARDLGVEVGIVIGGGNILRGGELERFGLSRVSADSMGMLATVVNSLLLSQVLLSQGVPSVVQSALQIETVVESITLSRTEEYLHDGNVVLFAGGTGSPYFTTDTAAALRACEIGADVLMKATKVDGVFDRDPEKHNDAIFFPALSYDEVLTKRLSVMDMAAVSMCRDRGIPIVVFNMRRGHELVEVIQGKGNGTLIKE